MLKNMKLRQKFLLSFAMILVLAILSSAVSTFFLHANNALSQSTLVNYGFSQGDIGKLNADFQRQRSTIRYLLSLKDTAALEDAQKQISDNDAGMAAGIEKIRAICSTQEELAALSAIESRLTEYKQVRDQVIALQFQGKEQEALDHLQQASTPVANQLDAQLSELCNLFTQNGLEAAKKMRLDAFLSIAVMIVFAAAALVVSFVIAYRLTRSICRPINTMLAASRNMTHGQLDVDVTYASSDEIGLLAQEFSNTIGTLKSYIYEISGILNEMARGNLNVHTTRDYEGDFSIIKEALDKIIASLNTAMRQINHSASNVFAGSGQVSQCAQDLAGGAIQQSSAVEELSSTIDGISAQVESNAGYAGEASRKAGAVGQEIADSNAKMGETISAMQNISRHASEIGSVIKTIEDISFQTNILALNAAVEAARAGTAGKGFAVVADEVRSLANKSSEAAKSTTAMIEDVVRAIETGSGLANDTAAALDSVVSGAREVASTVDKISKASREQAEAISQVRLGVEQVSSVVQSNSATAEQSAATSQQLNHQAQILKGLVDNFKLQGSGPQATLASKARP